MRSALGLGLALGIRCLFAADWKPPEYTVHRAAPAIQIDGVLDEPGWFAAPAVRLAQFPWFTGGTKEATVVKLLWDDQRLYVAHVSQDAHITARHTERDGKVPDDDCFEIMIAPNLAKPEVYFNLEWNVIGGILDNFRPNGPKQPRAPNCDAGGVLISGRYSGTIARASRRVPRCSRGLPSDVLDREISVSVRKPGLVASFLRHQAG